MEGKKKWTCYLTDPLFLACALVNILSCKKYGSSVKTFKDLMFNNVNAGNVHSEFSTLIKFESLIAHWYVKKQFDWGKDNVVTQKKKD